MSQIRFYLARGTTKHWFVVCLRYPEAVFTDKLGRNTLGRNTLREQAFSRSA